MNSDDSGVGKTFLIELSIVFGGKTYRAGRLPKEAIRPVLLRHPAMAGVDKADIQRAVSALGDAEFLRNYSSWNRLAGPLPISSPSVRRFVGWGLTLILPKPEGPVLPGCFCSELVAKFFQSLDIPLFRKSISPEHTSPNDLKPSRSFLEIVPEAVLKATDIPDDAIGKIPNCDVLQMELRPRHLPGLVRSRAADEVLGSRLDQLNDKVAAQIKGLEEMAETLNGLMERMKRNRD